MLTPADLEVLKCQDDWTLAEWWCVLNKFGWPEALPDPESVEYRQNHVGMTRSWEIMCWINRMVDRKLISRTWNKEMTESEFDDFWKGTYERDPEAKRRYDAWLFRKANQAIEELGHPKMKGFE